MFLGEFSKVIVFSSSMRNRNIIFIVVGRLGPSLTISKILPIQSLGYFDKIYVFHEYYNEPLEGVTFITNKKIRSIRPLLLGNIIRHIIEPLQLIYFSLILRPSVINGYQLVPKGINSFFASKLSRAKVIVSSIGGIPEIQTYFRSKFFWERVNLFILKHADCVTTKGTVVTNYLVSRGVSEEKLIVYNGSIDFGKFKPDYKVLREIDLIFVGSLTELKGPNRVLEIVKLLESEGIYVTICFLGSGPLLNDLKSQVIKKDLKSQVIFEGQVNNTYDFYKKSKIFILPSLSEGLSTAMLEAMACGCVPIVSDVGNTREAAFDNINSKVINDPFNIDGFVNATAELLTNEAQRLQLANNAFNLVTQNYSVDAQSKIFYEVLVKSGISKRFENA